MSETIRVPDIGNGQGEVIELLVKVGDRIEADQSLLTLESDKASMEIPAPKAGVVKAIKVKVGDTLKEGDEILELEAEGGAAEAKAEEPAQPAAEAPQPAAAPAPQPAPSGGGVETIKVPDIGNGQGEIIELMVKVGDRIEADQSLLTLESDKASMEIPAPKAGVVKAIKVKIGDTLKEGDDILELETEGGAATTSTPAAAAPASAPAPAKEEKPTPAPTTSGGVESIRVPDIGNGQGNVIELMVKVGDRIEADQSLLTLESDKASMEIPAPKAGVVKAIKVKIGDTLKEGDEILDLEVAGAAAAPAAAAEKPAAAPAAKAEPPKAPDVAPVGAPSRDGTKVHAGPAVRMVAREFGVELAQVTGSGPKGRILKEDVQAFVKEQLQRSKSGAAAGATGGAGIPPIPEIDFSKFGETEEVAMTRLMQVGASNLHRSWLNVPHVTQFESADITEAEAFRIAQKAAAEKAGTKLTILPILLKACAHLLRELPDFNSSLAPSGKALIRKKYVHIGFAVDTPDGLLVPVIRDVDRKGLLQLALEAAELAEKARTKKLSADAMQGACFTISSLGHIGGTGFTPIVNAPEVAILGVSKAAIQPVWDGNVFQPRLMLPLSLSYDHRVINGAAAARFTRRLGEVLGDIRSLLL
ncbi:MULTISPECIES: dihydrolipoyllysine-residue acetyltransferase [Pseudomonadaceae]|uniref:Acetyltransferase component of pyruvate dehydrogenase complex n=1 Tax=Pseudomonas denitrificans TaxID=43306 RepID=A0A9X7R4H1_PSEDE|nr:MULTISPECIES: dihydrolipoyllysine-residue acetyltransferase [Pseudomonadaceae]MBD9517333.1 dihydrolipoyllysine-residue acetyltransferase [Pseudomonas sp. PDM22]OQR33214.1 pyruvate dehydrogenase complex dihydrolipoyllysine-residue acetyltransferase [Pseudomonas sp. T]QEY72338.1 dihydrolipoyllysine-residue acetyltransferase [Pseudomonas denitrificans (nom. rej.)]